MDEARSIPALSSRAFEASSRRSCLFPIPDTSTDVLVPSCGKMRKLSAPPSRTPIPLFKKPLRLDKADNHCNFLVSAVISLAYRKTPFHYTVVFGSRSSSPVSVCYSMDTSPRFSL